MLCFKPSNIIIVSKVIVLTHNFLGTYPLAALTRFAIANFNEIILSSSGVYNLHVCRTLPGTSNFLQADN